MSIIDNLAALAGAIRDKINSMMPRLLPSGGMAGDVLTKASATDYATGWSAPSAGGGSQSVFVQQARPAMPGPWTWWVTDATGAIINCIVNDGVA